MLVYQRRILTGRDSLRGIGYNPDRSISVVCVSAPSVSTTSVHCPQSVSMGFDEDEALVQRALPTTDGSEERAVGILLSGQLLLDELSSANASSSPATRPVIFSMGFDEQLVQCALASAGGDEERAVDLLIRGRVSATASSAGQPAASTAPAPAPAPAAPVLNFATEWVCERGLIWPKAVDYITQCPKGHMLKACSALPRCHVCGEVGRGGGASCVQGCIYGVCSACLAAVRQPHAAVASVHGGSGFPSLGVSPEFLQAFKTMWGGSYAAGPRPRFAIS